MPLRLPPLSALRTFLAAANQLNFRRAAAELHVTPAAVSQQIRSLEEFFGQPLFVRTAHGLRLTPAGSALLPGIRQGFACLSEAVAAVPQAQPQLHIGAPTAFATRWLVPHLGEFSRLHPEIALHLSSSPDFVDAESPLPQALPETLDLVIRYGLGHYPGLQPRPLQAEAYQLVCHPASYRQEQPLAEWLTTQTLIHDESIPLAAHRPHWADWCRQAAISGIDCERGPRFSNAVLVHEAVLAGQGVALMQKSHIADDLRAGRLLAPLAIGLRSAYAYHLLMRRPSSPAAEIFADWLQALCANGESATASDHSTA